MSIPETRAVSATTAFQPTSDATAAAHDPFDAEWARSLENDVLAPLIDDYFRASIEGAERIPATGPVILAANHSGNAFPYDGIVLDSLLWRRDRMRTEGKFRTVYEHELSLVWWMRPFGIRDFWRRGGGVDMTYDNFSRLLARGDRVLYFPEGVPGIGKGFDHRYELQHFHTSFMQLAARQHVPVLPIYCVNGEWLHPFGYTFGLLDRLMQRVFHVPFLPLPIGFLGIVFPWIWYLAFPARLRFVVGEPLDIERALHAAGVSDLDKAPRAALVDAARHLRAEMQRGLDAAVARHGSSRYAIGDLLRAIRRSTTSVIRIVPLGWPVAFLRHERDRARPPARSRLHAWLRDWDLIGFYLPFGWPLLSLTRTLRRPPYGRRGLDPSPDDRSIWRLAERPLPPRG